MDQPMAEKPALGSPIVNIADVPLRRQAHGSSFDARLGSIGALRYLAVSTMLGPDVIEYPDSRKFAVFSGAAPGGDKARRTFSICARTRDAVEYWEGEE